MAYINNILIYSEDLLEHKLYIKKFYTDYKKQGYK